MLAALLPALAFAVPSSAGGEVERLEERRAESHRERERVLRQVELSRERVAGLAAEVEALAKDHETLTAALVEAAEAERRLSLEIEDIGGRLAELGEEEDYLRQSLIARRGVLAEVLGALQRMGRNPPPAILVRPDDALSSVRSAILLGAVVPELRAETEVLIADLNELSRVTASIEAEHDSLLTALTAQAEEKERMSLLAQEKQRLQLRSEERLARERERAAELAMRAGSMAELIEALEADIAAAREAEEAARKEELAAREAEETELAEPSELEAPVQFASTPFSSLAGQVRLPVAGWIARQYGDDDEAGGRLMGDIVKTHSGAIVTAPSDGSVLYAGPFRSYGQLLILNAGDGYHLVLAGMDRISVGLGQTVVSGEPVGAMGETWIASAAGQGEGEAGQELYIEFRKDGSPVDPAPWWAERNSVRTGNDT